MMTPDRRPSIVGSRDSKPSKQTVLPPQHSASGRQWVLCPPNTHTIDRLTHSHDLDHISAEILWQRGFSERTEHEIATFIRPRLRNHIRLGQIAHLQEAAERLWQSVCQQNTIRIITDYDVDGATSAGILVQALRNLGHNNTTVVVPNRLIEGYGLTTELVEQALADKTDLLVLLDMGTTAHQPIALAQHNGLSVIVVDHHQPGTTLPAAHHLINPKQINDHSNLISCAACALTWLLALSLLIASGRSRNDAWNIAVDWLDLVALGTLCDMVPLHGCNRAFVRHGLAVAQRSPNAGLATLWRILDRPHPIDVNAMAFHLGPCINAAGRMHGSDLGVRLLCESDPHTRHDIAQTLAQLNGKRKILVTEIIEKALSSVALKPETTTPLPDDRDPNNPIIWSDPDVHAGIAGLIASRLVDHHQQAVFVHGSPSESGSPAIIRGSARAPAGADLGRFLLKAVNEGLLVSGGGHKLAGGYAIYPHRLTDLHARILQAPELNIPAPSAQTHIDIALPLTALSDQLEDMLDLLAPFGSENPTPLILVRGVKVRSLIPLSGGHLKITWQDEHSERISSMAFSAEDSALGQALRLSHKTQNPVHVLIRAQPTTYRGRRVDLIVKDISTIAS